MKEIKTSWKYRDIKVEFSHPIIQTHENSLYISDISQIKYYYYGLTVYRKNPKHKSKKDAKKWLKIWSTYTYDAPAILMLPEIINNLMLDDFDSDSWQKEEFEVDGNKLLFMNKMKDTVSSWIDEDTYCFKRSVVFKNETKSQDDYLMYIGKNQEDCCMMSSGLLLKNLQKEDLENLKNVINSFIELSIEDRNKHTKKENENFRNSLKLSSDNSFLYKYKTEKNETEFIESIYVPGDILDNLDFVASNINENIANKLSLNSNLENAVLSISNCKIKGFEDGYIVLEGGTYNFNGNYYNMNDSEYKIPLNNLTYLFDSINDEKLYYNENQCYEDFCSILNKEIIADFKTLDLKTLEEKWKSVIVNRTWMLREEHGFENPYKVAKNIIKRIKKDVSVNT